MAEYIPAMQPDTGRPCPCFDDFPLAMAYIPMQKWREPYDNDTGFSRGTIFPALDKPYLVEEVR